MMVITMILGLAGDVLCYYMFMREFIGNIKKERWYILIPLFVIYSWYRLKYGYGNTNNFIGKDFLIIISEIILVFVCNLELLSMGKRSALTESLIFVIAIQVGRKLYYHVVEPMLFLRNSSFELLRMIILVILKMICVMIVKPNYEDIKEENIKTLEMTLLIFSLCYCFILSILNTEIFEVRELWYINLLCYIGAFICAYIVKNTISYNNRIANMQRIEGMMQTQYEIWNQKKEDDEAIKRMYHDLKHLLSAMKKDQSSMEEYIGSMQSKLEQYKNVIYTDNSVLNVIMNEKMKEAEKRGISFHIESGIGKLEFIEDADICSIFANLIDNAIEASEACEEGNRMIRLKYAEEAAYISFCIENNFSGTIHFKDGRPLTTKEDSMYHGIGLKSVEYALNKYGGKLKIDASNSLFRIIVFIPRP